MAADSVQQQVVARFRSRVQSKYGIDAAFVKHHILLQDHDSQAAAAETAEGSKKNGERRMYMQNPHKTAAVKELSVSCQLLLQHLLTLLREGTYPTCEQDWQREACFLLWLHDSQGGRLRACMPAVDALDVNLRPKTKLVKQLKELVGARVAELASKLDVMGLWQQLQYKGARFLLAGQLGQAAAEPQQQGPQQQAAQEAQQQSQQQQQQFPPGLDDVPPTRGPGLGTLEERRATLKDKLKSAGYKVSKEGYSAEELVDAFVAASGQGLDPSRVEDEARSVGQGSVFQAADGGAMAMQQWMHEELTSPDWHHYIMTPFCREKSPGITLGFDTWLGLVAQGLRLLTHPKHTTNKKRQQPWRRRVGVLGVVDLEEACVWLYPAMAYNIWKLEQQEATGVKHMRWREGCPYPGIRLELGVDPLPTPNGTWLFVERRGEDFFPVVPLSTELRSGLQAASPGGKDFVNGPYQFRAIRSENVRKYQKRQCQQHEGVAAGANGVTGPASPGRHPGDLTHQQQQQQTPSPCTGTPRRPKRQRVKRADTCSGSRGRGGSAQLTSKAKDIEQPLVTPPTLRSEPPVLIVHTDYEEEVAHVAAQIAALRPWSDTGSGWSFNPPRVKQLSAACNALKPLLIQQALPEGLLQDTWGIFCDLLGLPHSVYTQDPCNKGSHPWEHRFRTGLVGHIVASNADTNKTLPNYWNKAMEAVKDMREYPDAYKGSITAEDREVYGEAAALVMTPAKLLVATQRLASGQLQRLNFGRTTAGKKAAATAASTAGADGQDGAAAQWTAGLSSSLFKLWKNALNWLQDRQHSLLVGQSLDRSKTIHGDSTVRDESRNVRNTENKRLKATRADPGKKFPQAPNVEQKRSMADAALANKTAYKAALAGLQQHLLRTVQQESYARGDTARAFQWATMSPFFYEANESCMLPVDLQALLFTTGAIKGMKGDGQGNVVISRHRDVLECPVAALSLLAYAQLFCGDNAHGYPPVLEEGKKHYDWMVINNGSMEKGISSVTHYKHTKRMHEEAGINSSVTTHLARKVEARRVRCTHNTSVAELKQTGLWDQDVATKAYTSLPSGNTVAHNAGFVDRASYYIPRADLHPDMFGDTYADMMDANKYAEAATIYEELQAANKERQAEDIDTAGEEMMRGFATVLSNSFFQDYPFVRQTYPDHYIHQTAWVMEWWEEGSLQQWCELVINYTCYMEQARASLFGQYGLFEGAVKLRHHREQILQLVLAGNTDCLLKAALAGTDGWQVSTQALQGLHHELVRTTVAAAQGEPAIPPPVVPPDQQLRMRKRQHSQVDCASPQQQATRQHRRRPRHNAESETETDSAAEDGGGGIAGWGGGAASVPRQLKAVVNECLVPLVTAMAEQQQQQAAFKHATVAAITALQHDMQRRSSMQQGAGGASTRGVSFDEVPTMSGQCTGRSKTAVQLHRREVLMQGVAPIPTTAVAREEHIQQQKQQQQEQAASQDEVQDRLMLLATAAAPDSLGPPAVGTANDVPSSSGSSRPFSSVYCCIIKGRLEKQRAELVLVKLPRPLDRQWRVPNAGHTPQDKRTRQWLQWHGMQLGDSTWDTIWRDWTVSLHSPELGPMAPLRVLEDPTQCPGGRPLRNIWRNGSKIAPHIRWVKLIVYAIDRRIRGLPRNAAEAASNRQHPAMTFRQACADLEDTAMQLGGGESASSMSQMARDVVPTLLEFSPQEYEQYCAEVGIPLYSSSPADPPTDSVQPAGPTPSMAGAELPAQGLHGTEELAATAAGHSHGAGHGRASLLPRQLSLDYSDDDAIKEHQAAAERDERAALRQAQVAQEFAQEQQEVQDFLAQHPGLRASKRKESMPSQQDTSPKSARTAPRGKRHKSGGAGPA